MDTPVDTFLLKDIMNVHIFCLWLKLIVFQQASLTIADKLQRKVRYFFAGAEEAFAHYKDLGARVAAKIYGKQIKQEIIELAQSVKLNPKVLELVSQTKFFSYNSFHLAEF